MPSTSPSTAMPTAAMMPAAVRTPAMLVAAIMSMVVTAVVAVAVSAVEAESQVDRHRWADVGGIAVAGIGGIVGAVRRRIHASSEPGCQQHDGDDASYRKPVLGNHVSPQKVTKLIQCRPG